MLPQLPRRETGNAEDYSLGRGSGNRARARTGGGQRPEPELDRLSGVLDLFRHGGKTDDASKTMGGPEIKFARVLLAKHWWARRDSNPGHSD